MNLQPIRSENELRCRSRQNVDGKFVPDLWTSSAENSVDVDAVQEQVQHLQDVDVEPSLAGVDNSDSQTSASNKRQFCVCFCCIHLMSFSNCAITVHV